jgi:hypothetical protein
MIGSQIANLPPDAAKLLRHGHCPGCLLVFLAISL